MDMDIKWYHIIIKISMYSYLVPMYFNIHSLNSFLLFVTNLHCFCFRFAQSGILGKTYVFSRLSKWSLSINQYSPSQSNSVSLAYMIDWIVFNYMTWRDYIDLSQACHKKYTLRWWAMFCTGKLKRDTSV